MKAKLGAAVKEEASLSGSSSPVPGSGPGGLRRGKKSHPGGDKKYVVIQCTGYLKVGLAIHIIYIALKEIAYRYNLCA